MRTIDGWWFSQGYALSDGRQIGVGLTHTGQWLSVYRRAIDALSPCPGNIVWRVRGAYTPEGRDRFGKYGYQERTYVAGGIDVTEMLELFSQTCAIDVVCLWDMPLAIREALLTGRRREEAYKEALKLRMAAWQAKDFPRTHAIDAAFHALSPHRPPYGTHAAYRASLAAAKASKDLKKLRAAQADRLERLLWHAIDKI